jgi:hypothetical protein
MGSTMSSDDDGIDWRGFDWLVGGVCLCRCAAAVGCLGCCTDRRGGAAAAPEGDNESRLDRNASMPSGSGVNEDDSNDSCCCFRSLGEGVDALLIGGGGALALLVVGEGISLRLSGCDRFGPPNNPLRFSCVLLLPTLLADCVEKLRIAVPPFFDFDLAAERPFFLDFFETMAFKNRLRCFSWVLGPLSDQLEKLVTSFRQVRMSRVLARVMAT